MAAVNPQVRGLVSDVSASTNLSLVESLTGKVLESQHNRHRLLDRSVTTLATRCGREGAGASTLDNDRDLRTREER